MISARGAAEKTISAICDANAYYEKWTNGWWLSDSGGEALMLAQVAQQLATKDSELVVEMPMAWLDYGIPPGMRRRGPTPKDLRKGGRCDIGLIRPNLGTVYGLVELKRAQSLPGWQTDMKRLTTAMQRSPKLNFAILGGFVASSSEPNFRKKTLRWKASLKIDLPPKDCDLSVFQKTSRKTPIFIPTPTGAVVRL